MIENPEDHLLIWTSHGPDWSVEPEGFIWGIWFETCRTFVDPENPAPHDLASFYAEQGRPGPYGYGEAG